MLFELNKEKNKIVSSIEEIKFSDIGMSERNHLQEIIDKNPGVLNDELLIIQKEFNNWDGTKERLDLLAIDRDEKLVIIENKLDDTGKDVTWQIIKYTSYVSTFTKQDVINIYQNYLDKKGDGEKAEDNLKDFFEIDDINEIEIENNEQRLILVANNFRKEITASAIWLIDKGIPIQCFEVKPYNIDGKNILDFNQIIPGKDMEDYLVKIGRKEKVNKIIKAKKREVKEYELNSHLDGKDEDIKNWFIELNNLILDLNPNMQRIIRKFYVSYRIRDDNFNVFELHFPNKKTLEIGFAKQLRWDEKIKNTEKVRMEEVTKYQRENNKGRLVLKIENQGDLENAKELIKYSYNEIFYQDENINGGLGTHSFGSSAFGS